MKAFKQFVKETIDYNKIASSASKMHDKAKAAGEQSVKINGVIYSMIFTREGFWKVTDDKNNFVVNLNIRPINKAKQELKTWLNS